MKKNWLIACPILLAVGAYGIYTYNQNNQIPPIKSHEISIPDKEVALEVEEKILFGINTMNYHKKGYQFFEEALDTVEKKYPQLVDVKRTRNLPFSTYVKELEACDILMDTVYAFDQGYNALEAMSRGKVVFTGAEKEFMEHYNLTDRVAINALPDSEKIAAELENLILNPNEIERIGQNAREFIEREHDYVAVAKLYYNLWKKFI